MSNNFSLLHIEANQCKSVLEQVFENKPFISSKNKILCEIVQTVLFGMCDKIKTESLTATEKISAGILKVLLSNITSAYENMFEANELYIKEYLAGNLYSSYTSASQSCKALLKEVLESLNHVIQFTKESGEADIFWVSEGCPECGCENTFVWDVKTMGYKVHCPSCGAEMMLCDACAHADDNLQSDCHKCDWEQGEDGKGTCFRCKEN